MARATENNDQDAQGSIVSEHQVTKSTVVVIIILAIVSVLLVAGISYCGYRSRKERRDREKRLQSIPVADERNWPETYEKKFLDLEAAKIGARVHLNLEKPKQAVVIASSDGIFTYNHADEMNIGVQKAVAWVPQINPKNGEGIIAPKPSWKKQPQQPKMRQLMAGMHRSKRSETFSVSPPPSYFSADQVRRRGSIDGVLRSGEVLNADVGRGKLNGSDSNRVPAPLAPQQTLEIPVSIPLPSPARSESFAATARISSAVASSPQQENKRPTYAQGQTNHDSYQISINHSTPFSEDAELPRLMSVASTFTPTRGDELIVKVGDTVRMLEEYRDEWCLVQYVGKFNSAIGVIPRMCLQERRSVVPVHKASNSSLSSSSSHRR